MQKESSHSLYSQHHWLKTINLEHNVKHYWLWAHGSHQLLLLVPSCSSRVRCIPPKQEPPLTVEDSTASVEVSLYLWIFPFLPDEWSNRIKPKNFPNYWYIKNSAPSCWHSPCLETLALPSLNHPTPKHLFKEPLDINSADSATEAYAHCGWPVFHPHVHTWEFSWMRGPERLSPECPSVYLFGVLCNTTLLSPSFISLVCSVFE